ncbi:ribosomal protein S18 acetylase RimI-like enzyme [Arthrobacter sp. PvP023]|uniref:GNAT family N-acetyltransferase n=1 Tax=Micrococcaceae TaxID=1268 RepID=UPI001AE22F66|nr:N-acetyltransferase [Arthrobacter sp. PvP023]MBP1137594.1 ribosomal protein S18 acetylase RimI-like enzyme [Arthrobacter sp. PvP023]
MAEGEWASLRAVRLEMLADTPTAYVESLASAQAQTEGQWRSRAAAMTAPGSVTFVAEDGSRTNVFCGLMRVVVKHSQEPNRQRQAMLISVYVAVPYRGSGLADEMLGRSVEAAAGELECGLLQLGVHEDNTRALAFYARHGFGDTGRREAYALDPGKKEIIMERELYSRAPAA